MEDLVKQIIEIEKAAKDVTKNVRAQKEHLSETVSGEITKLRDSLYARADRRLDRIAQSEEKHKEELLLEVHRSFDDTLSKINSTYEKNKDVWVESLFKKLLEI